MSTATRHAAMLGRYELTRVGFGLIVSLACGLGYLLGRFA